ncbi:VirD4-like conjugal transfer protein, CD1115 family [Dysosmobacter sp.]|uniref:VirD4-like conjugal transfer protein, CD1115 family n=1 Tax=Dysosmobacter sp. TaxID=2591382 RepID=UPI003AF01B3B
MRDTGYRILADGITVSNDTWATGLANHDLIIGPTGGGKTRSYVLPNLLNSKESFIAADTKGSLRRQVGGILERRGFRVLELDFTNLMHSPWGYNPLRFIRWDGDRQCWNEQDIITVAAALVPVTSRTDPFWDLSARNYAEALIGYTLDNLPREEHTLVSVAKLFAEAETGVLDELMREYCTICPDSFVAMRWKFFQGGRKADKTYSSILAILSQKLSNYSFGGVQALFQNPNQIDFGAISREPTAAFIHVSDCDFSLQNLTSLFYTQALQMLIAEADSRPDNRLQIPVRLYLDDFSNLIIPDMDKTISIIRSREISVSIALQSVTQLEGQYGHAKAMTIIDNCDHLLYLGGQSVETARFISTKANKPASAILNLPLGKAWLFERGNSPREVKKYDLTRHPLYRLLPEYAAQRTVPEREAEEEPQLMAAAGM